MTIAVDFTGDLAHIYDTDGSLDPKDMIITSALDWAHLIAAIRTGQPMPGGGTHTPPVVKAFLCPVCDGYGGEGICCATCNDTGLRDRAGQSAGEG